MPRRKKNHRPARPTKSTKPACLEGKWQFGPDVPTYDFFEHQDPNDHGDLGEILDDLLFAIAEGDFLRWEAVVCDELGLPLTAAQEEALGSLLNFNDDPAEDRILYINEIPRPASLWYQIVRKVASHLLMEPYRTFDLHYEVAYEGWPSLVTALEEHGKDLSLPVGVDRPVEVVPAELRHKLWLQTCFDHLSGLGQEDELTLRNEEQQDRIEGFIRGLRERRETVAYLDLTLERLLAVLVLPPQDEPIFLRMMQEHLGLASMQDRIAGRL